MAVAFIPARGGSQRVKRKQLREVGGVSLTLRAVYVCDPDVIDRIVVSTEDEEIADVARSVIDARVEVHDRPADLAGAEAQIEGAISHWLDGADLAPDDVIVLLQPTSPFRRAETVARCVAEVTHGGVPAAMTVTPCPEADFVIRLGGRHWASSERVRAADLREGTAEVARRSVREDGCVYAFTVQHFLKRRNRLHPKMRLVPVTCWESFEIDTEADLLAAEALSPIVGDLIGGGP